jgi:oxygen-independent coproporphyrinogen-3 oxidase
MSAEADLRDWLELVELHPHEFTIQYPPRREYFLEHFRRSPAPSTQAWLSDLDTLLLYLHVPFCEARCYYCNFAVDLAKEARVFQEYTDALLAELESHQDWLSGRTVLGIDIGGGTPTRLPTEDLIRILDAVRPLTRASPHAFPLSIETTPRIAAEEPEKLVALRERGVTRLSMGVQSFNAETLASVNRHLQIEQTERAMANLRAAGFARVNLDVIFALPNQSAADWQNDLRHLITLRPNSITTYDCLYRGKGRALSKRLNSFPPAALYGEMYDLGYSMLTESGWHAPYGSVNFSRRIDETGTSAYFEGRLLDGVPYLGLGNYATSLRDNYWSFNAFGLRDYMSRIATNTDPAEFFYELPEAESQAKYVLNSLNFGFVDERRFLRRFGISFSETYSEQLAYAFESGLMQKARDQWLVAPGQFQRMHIIRSLFYSAQVRQWLQKLAGLALVS